MFSFVNGAKMFRHLNVFQYGEEELKIYTAWTSVRNSSLIDCHFITINLCSSLLYLHSLTLLNIQKIAVLASEFFSSRKLVVIKKTSTFNDHWIFETKQAFILFIPKVSVTVYCSDSTEIMRLLGVLTVCLCSVVRPTLTSLAVGPPLEENLKPFKGKLLRRTVIFCHIFSPWRLLQLYFQKMDKF